MGSIGKGGLSSSMNGPGVRVILKRFISLAVCFAFVSAEAAQAHAAAAGTSGAAPAAAMTMTRQPFPAEPGQARLPVTHVSVQSVHSGRSDVTILHVQDAHSNLSGQKNLAAALDELMTRYPVELVLVEGGSGDVTLDRLKAVGTREQWSRAAGRLLYEGLIAGEEYLNLTSDHTMRLEGIEEKALYRQSLKVYDTIVRHRKDTLPYLRRIALALERVKNRVYPQALLDYETALRGASLTGAGAQGEPAAADFSARTEKLLELARTVGTDLSGFAAVRELILLKTAEKRVHFERAQAEEEALLTAAYPDRGSDDFRSYVEARRKARVSPAAQLALMNDLLERSGRPRESLMMLGAYLKYLEDLSKIDMNALLLEMDLLEDAVYRDALKDSEDARMLRVCDRFLGLLQKAYRIRMSSDEFRTLKVNESDLPTSLVLGFLNRKLLDLGYVEDLTPYETPLEEARYAIELFYRLVDKRDRAFIANAKSAIAARGARTAVLITGGYHTAHLEKLMRAEDWSYAVLTPMVEYETDQDRYESLLLTPLKTARRKLAAAAARSVNAEAEETLRTARGPSKVRDGLRAQAAAARLSAADPASARVIESVFGIESRQVLLTAGARMTASPAAAAAARVRPQANGYRRAFIKVQNWFYRNASLALTSSLLSLTTSYLFPRALWWMTMGFLVLSLTASVHLAKRLRYARHAEIMSGVNVVFQSLVVAAVLYAGTGWKAGIDRAAERTRQLFKMDPIAETGGALTVGAVPLIDPVTVAGTAPAPSIAPKVVDAAPAPSVPETVLERARQASDLVLPDHVTAFNRAFVPLMSEVMISETALTGYTPGAETDPERRAEFGRHVREMAAVMSAVSRIETGKGYGGPEGTGMLEKGAAARASGVWQMNGATAKWVIANLIAQPDVYLKPFIDGSSDPEGMRAGILRLREAYREPLFDMFGVDLALGEDGWKRVVEAVKALTDDQMKRLMAEPDASKPRLDTSDRYRVQFVTARILMLFKGVRDAKTYMEFYNTSVQADPAFKGLTSWAKAETFFSHARFVLEAAFEAYGSGAELDTARLSALESKLALLEQAMDGVGETLYQMTQLLKLSVQEPGSDQAPELIKSIRDNVFKFRVQFGSLSELGFGALMERFVESVQKDISIIETRLTKAGVGVLRPDLPESVLGRMDSALVDLGGTSTASSLAYRASDDGSHAFVLHPALETLAREWMEGKGDWAKVPLAALAELTPRDTEAITEPGFTPLLSWMVLTRLNERAERFPGRPFRMHWVDPKAHYGKAKEFYASVLATFKQIYPEREFPAPDKVAKPADAGFFETHTNIEGERRPMTITGPKAGRMIALNAADKPVAWRHLYLTREIGAGFLEITSLKRGMEVDPASFNELVDEVALMFEQQGIGKDGRPVPIQLLVHRGTPAAGTAADQLPGIRLASVSPEKPAAPGGARMARQYEVLSRNALYAPGDAVRVGLYRDRVEFLTELFEANRPRYLRERAAIVRQVERTFSVARGEHPSDNGRVSRLVDRSLLKLKEVFLGSVPDEAGRVRDREFVSAEDILAEEMSGWDDVTPRELVEASRLLHQIMSGLDQLYFYADTWFDVQLVRAVPVSESRWVRRMKRAAERLRTLYQRLVPPASPDRQSVYRNLQLAVRDLKLAAEGDEEFKKALRASGLLALLGADAAAARRRMTVPGYPAALKALLENAEPDDVQSREVGRVLEALEELRVLRMTTDRTAMRQLDPKDGHDSEVARIQQFVDNLEYIAPVSDRHPGKLEYKSPEGIVADLTHLGSGVFNDVFDWNADYIVRVTRFQDRAEQFEDPELIRGAVAGVDGTGLIPHVVFFGRLRDGRSVQIIERMTETLDKHLTAASRYNTQAEAREVVNALDRFAVRAVESGYALEDAHTGNFMLTERFGRIEVVYSDIDGLQKIGTSPGSQFQVALHFRGQLLGYPSFNPWAHQARTLGRPLLRRLNLMIGGYQADRLAERVVNQADLAGIRGEQRKELDALQETMGPVPSRSVRTYDWENSFTRYMPSLPGDPGKPAPVTSEQIQEAYLETVKRVNGFLQKWPRTEETRWIADLLLLRAQWTRAMRMAHYQYENRWAKTSLDRMIEAYEGRQDIRPSSWWEPFLSIGWRRWTAAAAADLAMGAVTWLALGGSEGVYRLVQEHPFLAAAAGVSTALGMTGVVMLVLQPGLKRRYTVSGARMGMAELRAHFKALTGLDHERMYHGTDLYPGPYAHQIEQSLNFAAQAVEWLEEARLSQRLPEDREIRIADWGTGNGVLSMAVAKWARDRQVRVRISAVDIDARAVIAAARNMELADQEASGITDFRTVLLPRDADDRSAEVPGDYDFIFVNAPDVAGPAALIGSKDTVVTGRDNFDRMMRSSEASLGHAGSIFIESNLRPDPGMFGEYASMRILPLDPRDAHKRKVWVATRSRVLDLARRITETKNVKSAFASHEEDPVKVWSWMTAMGQRVYLKWLPADPSQVGEAAQGPDAGYLDDAMTMLQREGALLRKIFLEPRYRNVRGYFAVLADQGRISFEEAASLQGDGADGIPVPEGAEFVLTAEIPGVPLSEWIKKAGRSKEEIEELMAALASSVRAVHEAGIFHGDLGPSEVFIEETPDGRTLVRFADLGLAVLRGDVHLGLTDMMARPGLLTLANEGFNADAAKWVLALRQRDPWRARDLASLTNLYLFMIGRIGLDASKLETAAWVRDLLDPERTGAYAAAYSDYLRAIDAGAEEADPGARLAGPDRADKGLSDRSSGARMASGAKGTWFFTLMKLLVPAAVFAVTYLALSRLAENKMEALRSGSSLTERAPAAPDAGPGTEQGPMITEIPEAEMNPDEAERLLEALEKRTAAGAEGILASSGEIRSRTYFIRLLVDAVTDWQDRLSSLSAAPEWAPALDQRIDRSVGRAKEVLAEVDKELASLTVPDPDTSEPVPVAPLNAWDKLVQDMEVLRVTHPKGIRAVAAAPQVWEKLLSGREQMKAMVETAYAHENDDRSLFDNVNAEDMEVSLRDLEGYMSLAPAEYAQLVLDTQKHAKDHPAYKSGADGRFEMDERLSMNIRLWMNGAFRNAGDPVFYEVLRWSGLRKMERDIVPALWAVIRHLVAEDGTVRTPIVDLWPEGASPLTVYRSADKSAAALLPDVKHILHSEVHGDYEKFTNAAEAGTLTEKDGTIRKSGSYGSDNPVGGRPNLAFYKRGNYWELMTSDAALVLKPADLVHLKREYPKLIREWIEAMAKYRGWDPDEVGVAAALRIHTLYSEGDGVEDGDRAGAIAVRDANRTADLVANFKGGETVRTLLTRADVYGASPSAEFAELFSRKKLDSKALGGTVARLAGELERLKKERAPSDPEFILADRAFRAVRGYQSAYEFASAYLKFVGEDQASLEKRSHEMALTYLMTVIAETNLDPSIYGNPRSPGPAQTGYGSWKDALAAARRTLPEGGTRSEFQSGLIAENPDRVRLEKMHEFLLKGWSAGKAKTGPAAKLREFVRLAAEGEEHSDAFNALLSGGSDGPAAAEQVSPAVFFTIMMQKSMGGLSWTEYPLTAYHADFNTSTWQSWEAAAAAIGRTPAGLEADLKGIRVLDGGAVGPRTEAALVGAMETVMDAVLNGSDLGSLADVMGRTVEKMDSNGGLVRFFHNGAGKRILKAIAGPDASRKISFADWKEFLEVKKEVEARVGQDAGAYHWVARSMEVVAGYLESRSLVYSDKRPSEVASVKVPDGARMAANSLKTGFDKNARYLMAIHRELENAGHRTELTVYPAAGADVVSALIATDAREIVMIDRAPLGGPEDSVDERDRREYIQSKSISGWSPGYLMQNGVLAMIRLELEVFAGIGWDSVSYERVSGEEARITFPWQHPVRPEPVMRTVRVLTRAAGAEQSLDDWSSRIEGLRAAGPKTVFLKAGEYQSVFQRDADGASGEVPPGITDESALVQDILEVMGPGRQAVIADVPVRLNGSFRRIGESALVDALSSRSASFGYGTPGYSKRILPPQAFVYAGGTVEPASDWSLPSIIREQIAGRPAPAFRSATNITQSLRHPEMLLDIHAYSKGSGPLNVMVIGPGSRAGRSPMMEEVLLMLRHGERNRYVVIDPDPGVLEAAVRPQFRSADYEGWFSVGEKMLSDDDGSIRNVARMNLPRLQASKDRLQIEGFQADPAEIGDFGSDELDLVIAPFALGYTLRSVIERAGGEEERTLVTRWLTSLVRSLRIGGWIIVTPTDLGVLANSDMADVLEAVQRDLAAAGRELAVETDDPELIILSVGELSAGARMSWAPAKDDPRVLVTEPFYFADHRVVSPAEGEGVYEGIWRRVFGSRDHVQEVIAVRTLDNGDIRIARPAEGQRVSHAELGKALTGAEEAGSAPDARTAYILLDRLNGEPMAAVQHAAEVTARLSSSGAALDEWTAGMASLSMAVHVVEKLAAADGQDLPDLKMETTLLSFLGGAPVSQRGLTDLSRIQKILFTAVQAYRYASGGLSAGTMRSMVPDRAEQDIIWAAGYGLARAAGTGEGAFRSELDRTEDPVFHESSGYTRALDAARFFLAKERILSAPGSFEAAGNEAGAAAVKKQLHKLLGADLRKLASGNYMDEEYAFRAALAVRNAEALGLAGLEEPVRSALRSIDRVHEGRSDGRLERLFDDYRAMPDISERQRPHTEIAVHDFKPDIQTWHQRPQLALTDFGLRLRALGVKVWIRDDFEGRQVFHDGGSGARVDRLGDVSRLRLSKGFDARLKIKTVERNLPRMTSAQVMDVVRQLMVGTEPVEHPVLGALPAGFLTSGREISAVNIPDDRDARQLVLMDWAPYFTVIDRIRALSAAEPAPAAARFSDARTAAARPADVPVIRFRDFYGVTRLLASEGRAWAAEPMPVRAAGPDRSAAASAAAQQAAGTEASWAGLAADRVVAAFQSLRLNGRNPSFVTVLSSGARSAEYRARAEKTASMLRSVLGLGPDAFPVITAAEASDPRYASLRKVHLALDREMDEDAALAAAVIGRGLNIVSDEDPDSVSMAMVLQALMADVSGEEQDARKLRLLAERHGKFLQGIFGRLPSEADMVRALSGMFRVQDADQVRMVRALPVMGKTLGARLAEALLAAIETGRSA
jgi:serine/threonine protein kinase